MRGTFCTVDVAAIGCARCPAGATGMTVSVALASAGAFRGVLLRDVDAHRAVNSGGVLHADADGDR